MPHPASALLTDALDIEPDTARMLSSEPFGDGAVTGFALPDDTIAYVDTSGVAVSAETGWVADAGARERIWIHPADPHLPALAPVAFGETAGILLARLGIEAAGAPEMVGYRPGRRAVLRVETMAGASWVKVVRPSRVERIVDLHRHLAAGGMPVPEVLGWSPRGVLVLSAAAGTPATDVDGDPAALLDAIDALRAGLARVALPGTARTSLAARADWYAQTLGEMDREAAVVARRVAASVDRAEAQAGSVTIHGDLHLGQLFLDADGQVSGLIDVDTAGAGDPCDDSAAFIAHALASALASAAGPAARAREIAQESARRWGDSPRVAVLTAVHLVGHAVGAASTGDRARARRLLRWADSAAMPKRRLIDALDAA